MIQRRTKLVPADNSGVQWMTVIHIWCLKENTQLWRYCTMRCEKQSTGIVKDDELVKVVIVRTHKDTDEKTVHISGLTIRRRRHRRR